MTFSAELIEQDGNTALLRFSDGSKQRILLRRLIRADQDFIQKLINKDSKADSSDTGPPNRPHYTPKQIVDLPALTVSTTRASGTDDGDHTDYHFEGQVNPVRMEYHRLDDDKRPFRLSIAEEQPNAAGESLEASFWLAAIVAGLERGNNLSGIDVKFTLSGRVDGPSAGGLVCLALLSALDGKVLPSDFTFSGTVLPDGTIGLVGGLAEKIKASAKAGYTRMIIPAGIRYAEDLNSGTLVDLKTLAESLHIQLIRATNIRDVYAAIHSETLAASTKSPGAIIMPSPVERTLAKSIRESLTTGDHILNDLPKEEQTRLRGKQTYSHFLETRSQANHAFRAGQLYWAWDRALAWKLMMRAHANVLRHAGDKKYLDVVNSNTNEIRIATRPPWSVIENLSHKLTPAGAQTCIEIEESLLLYSSVDDRQDALEQRIEEIKKIPEKDLPKDISREQMMYIEAVRTGNIRLFISHVLKDFHDDFPDEQQKFSENIPEILLDRDQARAAERFFYTAYHTALNTLLSDVMANVAEDYDITRPEAMRFAMSVDDELSGHVANEWGLSRHANRWHSRLSDDSLSQKQRDFLTTYATQLYASYFADISSLIVRWGILKMDFTDEGFDYTRSTELSRMLREARSNAIRNIVDCQYHGIPCPQAIREFQEAEATRDDRSIDAVTVLATYWRASLQSQSLKMLFHLPTTLTRDSIWNSDEMRKATRWVTTYLRRNENYDDVQIRQWKERMQSLPAPQMKRWLDRYSAERQKARTGKGFNIKNITD